MNGPIKILTTVLDNQYVMQTALEQQRRQLMDKLAVINRQLIHIRSAREKTKEEISRLQTFTEARDNL